MNYVFSLVFLFSFMLIDSVVGEEAESIINGKHVTKNQFPWFVSIKRFSKKGYVFQCGGALISPRNVLTAAHCFYNTKKQKFFISPHIVVVGSIDINSTENKTAVSHLYYLKGFGVDNFYDIAVLKLEKSFLLNNEQSAKLSLPSRGERFVGKFALVIGLGIDNNTSWTLDGKLKLTGIEVTNSTDCKALPGELCGRAHSIFNGTTCFGDSGGPLLYENKLIGIVSTAGKSLCNVAEAARYSQVSDYIDFINGAKNQQPTTNTSVVLLRKQYSFVDRYTCS